MTPTPATPLLPFLSPPVAPILTMIMRIKIKANLNINTKEQNWGAGGRNGQLKLKKIYLV